MKVSGVIVALAAAAPMVSAIPFKMADFLSPVARSPEPVPEPAQQVETFPQYRSTNLTARALNETIVSKRSFIPEGITPRNLTKA